MCVNRYAVGIPQSERAKPVSSAINANHLDVKNIGIDRPRISVGRRRHRINDGGRDQIVVDSLPATGRLHKQVEAGIAGLCRRLPVEVHDLAVEFGQKVA